MHWSHETVGCGKPYRPVALGNYSYHVHGRMHKGFLRVLCVPRICGCPYGFGKVHMLMSAYGPLQMQCRLS